MELDSTRGVCRVAPPMSALAGPARIMREQSPQGCYCDDVCASQGIAVRMSAQTAESLSFVKERKFLWKKVRIRRTFQCANGEQIVAVLVCNGIPNWWDGSDEQNCGEEEGGESWEEEGGEVAEEEGGESWEEEGGEGEEYFVCNDGVEIPASWVNDGECDCAGGEDEFPGTCEGEETPVEEGGEAWEEEGGEAWEEEGESLGGRGGESSEAWICNNGGKLLRLGVRWIPRLKTAPMSSMREGGEVEEGDESWRKRVANIQKPGRASTARKSMPLGV